MSNEDKSTTVYKVIGGPGTGKTTRVVGNPELELDGLFLENMEEYPLHQQMLVTYTNAGVDEAADRLKRMLDEPKTHIDDRVTTIHSRSYSLLNECPAFDGLKREQVVNHWDKKEWCDQHDLEYGWSSDEDDIMGQDVKEGNSLFQIYGWLQDNRKGLDEWEDCPQQWTGMADPQALMEDWERYKQQERLVGFGDMIAEVLELGKTQLENLNWTPVFGDYDSTLELFLSAPEHPKFDPDIIRGKGAFVDTKVLYVDEVQDLTPLQWEWYLLQKMVCDKVYLGGDDDQTIYGWSGADPGFMLNEEGDFEVLDKTYRIPKNVWEVCDEVIQNVDERQPKEVTPHGDGGEVINLVEPTPNQIISHIEQSDDVFMLFRARYMIDEFRDVLHSKGIPYRNMSTFDTWGKEVIRITRALGKIQEGKDTISHEESEALVDAMADKYVDKSVMNERSTGFESKWNGVPVDVVTDMFSMPGISSGDTLDPKRYLNWAKQDGELNHYEQQAILGVLKHENYDMSPERLKLGTIHSSKGKEAETVILVLDSTQTIMGEMYKQTRDRPDKRMSDAERRVYYVGMSRSSNKLVLAQGLFDPDMTITLSMLYGRPVDADKPKKEANIAGWGA